MFRAFNPREWFMWTCLKIKVIFLKWCHCHCYRPKRSFGQGNIFTGVFDSVHREGGLVPGGYLQIFGGVLQIFRGVSNFSGMGGSSKFSEGSPIFRGRGSSKFLGVGRWGSSKFWRGWGVSTGIRSTFGRYASYWNAFLFTLLLHFL